MTHQKRPAKAIIRLQHYWVGERSPFLAVEQQLVVVATRFCGPPLAQPALWGKFSDPLGRLPGPQGIKSGAWAGGCRTPASYGRVHYCKQYTYSGTASFPQRRPVIH
jgi:hypothetical protein